MIVGAIKAKARGISTRISIETTVIMMAMIVVGKIITIISPSIRVILKKSVEVVKPKQKIHVVLELEVTMLEIAKKRHEMAQLQSKAQLSFNEP